MAEFGEESSNALGKRKTFSNGNDSDNTESNIQTNVKKPNLNISKIDKDFEKALKELGLRKQCALQPNLNVAKARNSNAQNANSLKNHQFETLKNTDSIYQENENSVSMTTDDNMDAEASSGSSTLNLNEDKDWETPKKSNKYPSGGNFINNASKNISTQNRFMPLQKQSSQIMQNDNSDETKISMRTAKEKKTPPIYCRHTSAKELICILASAVDKTNFHLKDCRNQEQTIMTNNIETFKKIKEKLKSDNIPFYTYTPSGEKNKILVLKGINNDFTTEDIKTEIFNLNVPSVQILKVEKLKTKEASAHKNILLIQFSSDSTIRNITKIKHLANLKVTWEPYRKNKVYQCHNCQRVGHASINCNLGYRCVKCNESHEPGKCKRKKEASNEEKPFCVNCKEFGHTANYRGCLYLRYAQSIVNSAKQAPTDTQRPIRTIRPNLSYAKATQAQGNNNIRSATPNQNINVTTSNLETNNESLTNTIENLLLNFKQEIIATITNHNAALQNQLNNQNSKIKVLFNKLDLQWIE